MVLDYYGIKILVNSENEYFYALIKDKYEPVIKIDKNSSDFIYGIDIKIGEEPLFSVNGDFKRRIIHGGNRREYYITALIKQEELYRKIYFDKNDVYILVNMREKSIICYGRILDNIFKIFDLIIIELFFRTIERDNYFHFHASAVSDSQDNTIIFVGEKNAGKTTFLLEFLTKYGYKYVCNDNCFVGMNNNYINIIPWFEDLKIKTETLKKYGFSLERVPNCEYSKDGEKVFITLSKMINEFNIHYSSPQRLREIVLLEYTDEEFCIETTSKNKFKNEIYCNIKVPHDSEHYEFLGLFDEFDNDRFEQLDELLSNIEKKIRVTKITYNNNSFDLAIQKFIELRKNQLNICCRTEEEKDYEEIEEVVKSDKYRPWKDENNNEWINLRRFRNSERYKNEFSIVALSGSKIVGHIIFCDANISNLSSGQRFLYFVLQSVHTDYQGKGVGTTLVKHVESIARELGYIGIIALGHADFFLGLGYFPIAAQSTWKYDGNDNREMFINILNDAFMLDAKEHVIEIFDLVNN